MLVDCHFIENNRMAVKAAEYETQGIRQQEPSKVQLIGPRADDCPSQLIAIDDQVIWNIKAVIKNLIVVCVVWRIKRIWVGQVHIPVIRYDISARPEGVCLKVVLKL